MPISFPPMAIPVPVTVGSLTLVPLIGQSVHAGFPSPADDFIEAMIDLNTVLVQNPTATFMWRVGDCMIDVKIFPGDCGGGRSVINPKTPLYRYRHYRQ